MQTIEVKGLDAAIKNIKNLPKQLKFAEQVALTMTAKQVHGELTGTMKEVFDRPTPYALRGLSWLGANKGRPEAKVFARQWAGKGTPAEYFLNPQVYGGQRRLKRFERALQAKGLMPKGWVAVPGPGARMDAYGNISRGQIVQILSALMAFGEQGYMANRTMSRRSQRKAAGANYFVPKPGPGAPPIGVYQHLGGHRNIPVLIFKPAARYPVRFPFVTQGREIANRVFAGEFEKALARALATAK